jgi:RHS repeat-associated protein
LPRESGTSLTGGGIGGLLARSGDYSGGVFSQHDYYHADGLGNITYLADNTQSQAASYAYDPYGNLMSSAGTLATANTYRFSSREYVPSSGLYVYLYRFYNPGTERWLNQDPLGEQGGIYLYGFVGNNPVNRTDLYGLCWEDQLQEAQKDIDWALNQLTEGGFPNANSPLLSVNSPLGQFVSTVYTDAQNNKNALLAAAGGAAGLGAQATAVGTSSVGFVFSSAGIETFGAGAVTAAGGAVVLAAGVGAGVGYGISQIPVGGGENVADKLGSGLYYLCPSCF